jgi:ABC-type Na+ transport system ATPase subunit NatA
MMVSKETQAPNELPRCEAPIFPSCLIHSGSWKGFSQKSISTMLHMICERPRKQVFATSPKAKTDHDSEERARFRYLLADLAAERVVNLSTHIVSDVEATAERVALMDSGRILANTTPEDLLAGVEGKV